jgi:hypothetical protein
VDLHLFTLKDFLSSMCAHQPKIAVITEVEAEGV